MILLVRMCLSQIFSRILRASNVSFFKTAHVLGKKESFRLTTDKSSDFQPSPPDMASSFPSIDIPSKWQVEDKWLKATEELCRRTAIAAGQAEASMSALMTEVGKLARSDSS